MSSYMGNINCERVVNKLRTVFKAYLILFTCLVTIFQIKLFQDAYDVNFIFKKR